MQILCRWSIMLWLGSYRKPSLFQLLTKVVNRTIWKNFYVLGCRGCCISQMYQAIKTLQDTFVKYHLQMSSSRRPDNPQSLSTSDLTNSMAFGGKGQPVAKRRFLSFPNTLKLNFLKAKAAQIKVHHMASVYSAAANFRFWMMISCYLID